jgi:predicted membrane metal-binding protein
MNLEPDAGDLAAQLASACTALWTATLSLMVAFMKTPAPAHRYLIARKIARNLTTLHVQDCFSAQSRASFGRLSRRWSERADRLAPNEQRPRGGIGLLAPGLFNR